LKKKSCIFDRFTRDENPRKIAALKILNSIDSTAYLLDTDLYALVAAKRVNFV